MWLFDYLETEIGVTLYRNPIVVQHHGQNILVGHGDGLGPGDYGYKRLKWLFRNRFAQWLLARLHPNLTMRMAYFWSGFSRSAQPAKKTFLGPDKEWLIAYSERKLSQQPELNYCIFGHRHLPIDYTLSNGQSRYLNLGEWLHYTSYVRLAEGKAELLYFAAPPPEGITPG